MTTLMKFATLAVLLPVAFPLIPDNDYTYARYLTDYRKTYFSVGEDARTMRETLFNTELSEVLQHNRRQDVTWKAGINHMSDWTPEEKKALRGYDRATGRAHCNQPRPSWASSKNLSDLPLSVDWRLSVPPVLTSVKDQGGCGSCWAFATAQTIESRYAIAEGTLWDLSEQQIASCASNPRHCGGRGGCKGGTAQIGFQHVIDSNGLLSEWSYPYTSHGGLESGCTLNQTHGENRVAALSSFVNLPTNDEPSLLEALTHGPVAVAVDASSWLRYETGVFDGCNTSNPVIDHAVQLVGYGAETTPANRTIQYWIVRNSWAPTWGESGFIRLLRGEGHGRACGVDREPAKGQGCDDGPKEVKVCGMCGVLYDNAYPVVRKVH